MASVKKCEAAYGGCPRCGECDSNVPLFLCPELAAERFGLPEDYVRELLKGPNPIPHIPRGRNKLVCVPLARDYFIDRCRKGARPTAASEAPNGRFQG